MPNKSTVKLVSQEGFEFIIDYKAACVSNTIRNMLSSQGGAGSEQQHGRSAWRRMRCAPSPHAAVLTASMNLAVCAGNFTETELGEVKFPEISTPILEKVCQYFYYKLRYQNS